MKAIFITRYGGPEVLELRPAPEAQPKPGQVVVKVEAAGVNFADILATRGSYPGTPEPPFIAGREFAGVVEDTGERVMGYTQSRAFAERIAVRPQLLWPVPAGWSATEAAAFPVNYFTAYFAYWKAGLLASGPERESRGDPPRVWILAVAGYSDSLIPPTEVGQKWNDSYDQHRNENCTNCESHGNHPLEIPASISLSNRRVPTRR